MARAKPDEMTERVNAVEHYLTQAFPHARIEVVLEPEPERREDRGFYIFDQQEAYFLNVPSEFLADNDAAAIANYLHHWEVAQRLRDAEAKQVTVLRGEPPIKAESELETVRRRTSALARSPEEERRTMTSPSKHTVPVQLHRAQGLLVLAAPMPGLEPQDISVSIHKNRVTIRGEYRASRHDQPETLISEWTMGPYHRDVSLPQPVSGGLTNATYGNGVLVLAMPILESDAQADATEFQLKAETGTRGQHVSHRGSQREPAMPRPSRP